MVYGVWASGYCLTTFHPVVERKRHFAHENGDCGGIPLSSNTQTSGFFTSTNRSFGRFAGNSLAYVFSAIDERFTLMAWLGVKHSFHRPNCQSKIDDIRS